MAFDDLLDRVGGTGRFQAIQVTLLCLPVVLVACHTVLQNFVAFVPPHYCSAHRNQSALSRLSPEESLLVTVPLDQEGRPQRCQRYASPQLDLLVGKRTSRPEEEKDWESDDGSELQGCTDGWTYNMTEMSSTIISEWNLVCDLHALNHMGQTIFMGGLLVGTLTMGVLSDRFGRRILMLTSNLLMAVGGTCASFSSSFSLFCLFRFVCGMATAGIMLNSMSLTVEWIPTRVRTVVGSGTNYSFTIGQLILAVVAYFIRDWRKLTLALSLPFYVFFLYSWLFLESVRWLVLKKKPEQAVKNLRTVARINGRCEEGKKIDIDMLQESMKREISCSQGSYSVLSLFRTPTMRTITVCLSVMWFSTGFAYYGLAMDLQKFGVDIFLVQVIFGAVDIPAKLVAIVTMNKIGRRPSLCTALILSGVTIFINLLIPYEKQMVRTSLAVLGKGCLSASFTCCTLYSAEMYPTVLRQTGFGWVNMTARIGAMLAPMVLYLGDMVAWLPGFVYGGAPVISGVVAIFLPETLGSPLPDTIQDVEDRGSGRRKGSSAVPKKKEELPMQNLSSPLMKENA